MASTARDVRLDGAAVCLSVLCLIHCLALPIAASALPVFASISEAEWLHKAFVLLTVPISFAAILSSLRSDIVWVFGGLVTMGIGFLIAGAFVEAWHDYETLLTVTGAVIVSIAHLLRWRHSRIVTA
ncbi:MAG: MerC domain-containing protein [Pseudomonadota bacterium]